MPECRHCGQSGRFYRSGPAGYVAWHEWAETMSRTHMPVACDGCGRFSLWEPFHVWLCRFRTRDELVEQYAALLRDCAADWPGWSKLNREIIGRWSAAALEYIKLRAWRLAAA